MPGPGNNDDFDIFKELGFDEFEEQQAAAEAEPVDEETLAREHGKQFRKLCDTFDALYRKHALDGGELSTKEAEMLKSQTEAFLETARRLHKPAAAGTASDGIRPQDMIRQQVLHDAGLLNPEEEEKFRINIIAIRSSEKQPDFADKLLGFHDNLMQKLGGVFAENPAISGILNGLNKAVHATHNLMCGISTQPMGLMAGLLARSREPEMMNGVAGYVSMNKPLVVLRYHQLPIDMRQQLERDSIAKAGGLKRAQVPMEIVELRLRDDGNRIKGYYRHKKQKLQNQNRKAQQLKAQNAKRLQTNAAKASGKQHKWQKNNEVSIKL